jgi:hypothetical protein
LIFHGEKAPQPLANGDPTGAAGVSWSYLAIEMKMAAKKASEPSKGRIDGRKALLLYMSPSIIRELKLASLDDSRHALGLFDFKHVLFEFGV